MTLLSIETAGLFAPAAENLVFAAGEPGAMAKVVYFFVSGGFFMVFIGACSLIALSVVIHRLFYLQRRNVVPIELEAELMELDRRFAENDTSRIGRLLAENDSMLSRVARIVLSGDHAQREEASAAAEAGAREELVKLQSGVAILEVVITISPLLGLLGTVSGLVQVFGAFSGSGGGLTDDPALVARGIAEALNTTIAGLAVAVPTVVAHSYLTKKIERFAVRIEVLVNLALAVCYGGMPRAGEASSSPSGFAGDHLAVEVVSPRGLT